MLSVTEPALDHLSSILPPSEDEAARVLRLTVSEEGLALVPDVPRTGDEIHRHAGRPLLVLDDQISSAVDGRELGIQFEQGQATLTLAPVVQ